MAAYFLDTSAAVKRYVQEAGTSWIQDLYESASGHEFYLCRIAEVEVTAALAKRRRQGHLSTTQVGAALGRFRGDLGRDHRVVEVTVGLLKRAGLLADAHDLRAYDAVQLAAALEIRAEIHPLILISSDNDLNDAALAEGFTVEDPNHH